MNSRSPGTARVSTDADAPTIAAALGTPDVDAGAVRATAKEFMQGCLACRPEAAIDGDLATAWQTPFVGVRDQWVDYELPAPITFDRMDLSVVADGRHSVPTRIRLEVGDDVRVLTLPPIGDAAIENATATVPLTFPAVTGRTVRVTIEDVREVNTFSYFSNSLALTPAGDRRARYSRARSDRARNLARWRVSRRPAVRRRRSGADPHHRHGSRRARDRAARRRDVRPRRPFACTVADARRRVT